MIHDRRMLATIFGNKTAALILLYLEQHGSAYATEISRNLNLPLNMVQNQLERFRKGNLLTSTYAGKRRLYGWNRDHPHCGDLRRLLRKNLSLHDPADGTLLSPPERLKAAEELNRQSEKLSPAARYRPFTMTFGDYRSYEAWRQKQRNPWLV